MDAETTEHWRKIYHFFGSVGEVIELAVQLCYLYGQVREMDEHRQVDERGCLYGPIREVV